jgi:hypothetical protein
MPVIALVLTLTDDPAQSRQAQDILESDTRMALGPLIGRRLPVAATTEDDDESERLLAELRHLDGVTFLELVMVDYSDTGCAPVCGAQR